MKGNTVVIAVWILGGIVALVAVVFVIYWFITDVLKIIP